MPTYTFKVGNSGGPYQVDADLDNMHMSVEKIPTLTFGEIATRVNALPKIEFGEVTSNVHIKELPRLDVNVALTQIPDVRAHLPAHYKLGIALFGVEILSFSLCGESQVITEKYVPRRMEVCG